MNPIIKTRPRRASRLLLLVGLLLLQHVAPAQTVSGVGARRCEAFLVATGKNSDEALDAYVSWSQGFISGFNWSNVRQRDLRIDAAAILVSLGEYCSANPGGTVFEAVQFLIGRNAR